MPSSVSRCKSAADDRGLYWVHAARANRPKIQLLDRQLVTTDLVEMTSVLKEYPS